MKTSEQNICHICGSKDISLFPGFRKFYTVTSDCKPWRSGLDLCICKTCGCVQKRITQKWKQDIKKIYDSYTLYYQSEGKEQPTFNQNSGKPSPRSKKLLESVFSHFKLPVQGRMMDVGCGNGALLRSFNMLFPKWALDGYDLNPAHKASIEAIPAVEAFYSGTPDKVPGTFDLITLLHSIEHILSPVDFLRKLQKKLRVNGLLLVHTANFLKNPFDFIIADHCTHFTIHTLKTIIENAGFEVVLAKTDLIQKEMTVLARKNEKQSKMTLQKASLSARNNVQACLKWLKKVSNTAQARRTENSFGIFGSSIAATWLFSELQGRVKFFVDEDPVRTGKKFMKRPVYDPENVPVNSHVFIALPYTIGRRVKKRIKGKSNHIQYYLPPVLALWEKTLVEKKICA